MGYTTNFRGGFKFSRQLTADEAAQLTAFSEERHGNDLRKDEGYPGFYCDWVPNADRTELVHNGAEKFHSYVEWLQLLIKRYFEPWGIEVNGKVLYRGEDITDNGYLIVENNVVRRESL